MKISPEKKLQMYLKRDSCDGRRWMNDGLGNHIRAKSEDIADLKEEGWIEGRIIKKDKTTGQFTK